MTDKPPFPTTWHVGDEGPIPAASIVLHADGRIEGDADAFHKAMMENMHSPRGWPESVTNTLCWLLWREMVRQKSEGHD